MDVSSAERTDRRSKLTDGRIERAKMGPALLNGRRLRLRPITPQDYAFVHEVNVSQDVAYRWRHSGAFPPYEAVVQWLHREYNPQFVVSRRDTDERVGWVLSYSVDLANGTTYIGIMMTPEYIGSGLGLEAAVLFINYLFASWNLRKIYSEAPDFTMEAMAGGLGRFFKEEGVLKAHRYYQGRFWDEHILAIYRDDWEQVISQFFPQDEHERSSMHPMQWWRGSSDDLSVADIVAE
jgi:RimJ/RimL family protein N-acetyltransferase